MDLLNKKKLKDILTTFIPDSILKCMIHKSDEIRMKRVLHRIKIRMKYINLGKRI